MTQKIFSNDWFSSILKNILIFIVFILIFSSIFVLAAFFSPPLDEKRVMYEFEKDSFNDTYVFEYVSKYPRVDSLRIEDSSGNSYTFTGPGDTVKMNRFSGETNLIQTIDGEEYIIETWRIDGKRLDKSH